MTAVSAPLPTSPQRTLLENRQRLVEKFRNGAIVTEVIVVKNNYVQFYYRISLIKSNVKYSMNWDWLLRQIQILYLHFLPLPSLLSFQALVKSFTIFEFCNLVIIYLKCCERGADDKRGLCETEKLVLEWIEDRVPRLPRRPALIPPLSSSLAAFGYAFLTPTFASSLSLSPSLSLFLSLSKPSISPSSHSFA